jgi:hypothetical protein
MTVASRFFASRAASIVAMVVCLTGMMTRPAAAASRQALPASHVLAWAPAASPELTLLARPAGVSCTARRHETPARSTCHQSKRHVVPEQGHSPLADVDSPQVALVVLPITPATLNAPRLQSVTVRDLPPRAPPVVPSYL